MTKGKSLSELCVISQAIRKRNMVPERQKSYYFEKNRKSHVWSEVDGQKKTSSELMKMFGLTMSMEMAAKANALRWFGHVLNRKRLSCENLVEFRDERKEEERALEGRRAHGKKNHKIV